MNPVKTSLLQRGALLIVAIVLVLVIAVLVLSLSFMAVSNIGSSGGNISSAQALYVAEAGLQRALYLRGASGTAICGTLNESGVAVGTGTLAGDGVFAISGISTVTAAATLSAPITSAVTVIPITSGAAIAGYAPHGRVTINSEEINYARIATTASGCAPVAAPCLTGARRGMGGTIASAAAAATPLSQNQCLFRATGAVNTGRRVLEAAVAPQFSDFLNAPAVSVGVAATTLATLNTRLPAGDKIILAVVALRDSDGNAGVEEIAIGALQLRRGATVLTSNQSLIRVDGSAAPSGADFPQKTQYLLFRDTSIAGTAANPSYNVIATASATGMSAQVKLLAINLARRCTTCFFPVGAPANVPIGVGVTTLATLNTTPLPAGDNIVIAAVQLDNLAGGPRFIPAAPAAGALRLNRTGGPANPLATNAFIINFSGSGAANRGGGFLLLGRDAGAPANPTYTVTAARGGAGGPALTNGEAKIIVLNGLRSAYASSVNATSTLAAGAGTSMVGVTTTLAAGENVVIASTQYDNNVGATRTIAAGNERIVFGGVSQVSNAFPINLCTSGTAICDDFSSGLIWQQRNAHANPIYSVHATASTAASILFFSRILVIHVNSPPTLDWQEIYPP